MALNRSIAPDVHHLDSVDFRLADVFTLTNGARVHALKGGLQPVVRLEVVFKAGKWYEPFPAVSYLTSKLLLEGSRHHTSKQIADIIAFYGASLECTNGFDRTTISLYCLSKFLPDILPLLIEILTEPSFQEDELSILKTRTIQNIKVERQKVSYVATELFTKTIYGSSHPYRVGLIESDITNVTSNTIQRFYNDHYRLSQADIFLCGEYSGDQLDLVITSFDSITGNNTLTSSPPPPHNLIDPTRQLKVYEKVEDSIQAAIRIGGHLPLAPHADYPELFVLNKVLGGYFGSRLMKNIREDKGYTYGIYSSINLREHDTLFYISTEVNSSVTTATLTEIYKEIENLRSALISSEELATVKNYMVGKYLNELATIFEKCDKYKLLIFLNLPPDYYQSYITRIRSVSPERIKQLAEDYLVINRMVEVYTC